MTVVELQATGLPIQCWRFSCVTPDNSEAGPLRFNIQKRDTTGDF